MQSRSVAGSFDSRLTNIHRHSEGATATIQLSGSPGRMTLAMKDEGKGVAADKLSAITSFGASEVGIRGMQERVKDLGGNLEIAFDETGTEIRIAIPCLPHG